MGKEEILLQFQNEISESFIWGIIAETHKQKEPLSTNDASDRVVDYVINVLAEVLEEAIG